MLLVMLRKQKNAGIYKFIGRERERRIDELMLAQVAGNFVLATRMLSGRLGERHYRPLAIFGEADQPDFRVLFRGAPLLQTPLCNAVVEVVTVSGKIS